MLIIEANYIAELSAARSEKLRKQCRIEHEISFYAGYSGDSHMPFIMYVNSSMTFWPKLVLHLLQHRGTHL